MRKTWGRGRPANYRTQVRRVPEPVLKEVDALIEQFHRENEAYLALPLTGPWWDVLGLSPLATREEVRQQYRLLAKRYHPDQNLRLDAEARFEALQRAYQEALVAKQ